MNAMTYLNVTARLAYYDAMKKTAPVRPPEARQEKRPRPPFFGFLGRRKAVIVMPPESQHA